MTQRHLKRKEFFTVLRVGACESYRSRADGTRKRLKSKEKEMVRCVEHSLSVSMSTVDHVFDS